MKKYFFTFLFACLTVSGGFSADRIDNIVATVELIRREPITKASVDARYDEIKKAMNATDAPVNITKKEVLDQLIDVALLVQGADRDGIRVSDSSYNNFKKQKLAELSTLLKRSATDKDLEIYGGMTLERIKEAYTNQEKIKQYVAKKKPNAMIPPEITEEEARAEFRKQVNAGTLNLPARIRVSQIYIDTTGLAAADKKNAKKVIDEAGAKVASGKMSFEDAARTYSEDRGSKYNGGAMGWLLYSEAFRLMDAEIVETLFALPVGGVTSVLETERGYHIFKITAKEEAGIPKYDDKIDPEQSVTFGDSIKERMQAIKMYEQYNTALQELSKELREEAEIKYFQKDLD